MFTEHSHKVHPIDYRINSVIFPFLNLSINYFKNVFSFLSMHIKYAHCSKLCNKIDLLLFNFRPYVIEMLCLSFDYR